MARNKIMRNGISPQHCLNRPVSSCDSSIMDKKISFGFSKVAKKPQLQVSTNG